MPYEAGRFDLKPRLFAGATCDKIKLYWLFYMGCNWGIMDK
jgi:hypothetical protein